MKHTHALRFTMYHINNTLITFFSLSLKGLLHTRARNMFLPFVAADSDQCKYGKNRVEADAKRLQTKEEELMKRKNDIRGHLTQLKKERRDLRTAVEAAAGRRRRKRGGRSPENTSRVQRERIHFSPPPSARTRQAVPRVAVGAAEEGGGGVQGEGGGAGQPGAGADGGEGEPEEGAERRSHAGPHHPAQGGLLWTAGEVTEARSSCWAANRFLSKTAR